MSLTRRQFLATTATAAVVSSFPSRFVFGQTKAAAKYRRLSIATAEGQQMLKSYAKGIEKMLSLPPDNPQNWYRNAFIHTLDCPHGNWWFLPWHRGYTGWFEETIRSLSGDPNFALPFWDWTKQPFVPPDFWQGVLNPSHSSYIASGEDFYAKFKGPMAAYWTSLTGFQRALLLKRGYKSVDDLWTAVRASMFFPPNRARSLTQGKPNFDEDTQNAVSIGTIRAALAAKKFSASSEEGNGFGSGPAEYHSDGTPHFGILEGQPHNNVHNDVGGFMGDFLSPVDPLFFMHHCNIDRLWNTWDRMHGPIDMPSADFQRWKAELFLFYIDGDGKPVNKNTAGDYENIGGFDYDYASGSGDEFIGGQKTAAGAAAAQLFVGKVKAGSIDAGHPAEAEIKVPAALLEAASGAGQELFVSFTVTPPDKPKGARFRVFVNPPAGEIVQANHPSFAGTASIFGGHAHGKVEFVVALTSAVQALRTAQTLKTDQPLRIQVVADRTPGITIDAAVKAAVTEVKVGAF